jgi:molybdenum cofactor biosynthesis enzyme
MKYFSRSFSSKSTDARKNRARQLMSFWSDLIAKTQPSHAADGHPFPAAKNAAIADVTQLLQASALQFSRGEIPSQAG